MTILAQMSIPPVAPESRSMSKSKKMDEKRFFWKGQSIDSIPPIIALLDAAKARMQASNLQLQDQGTMSKETFCNAVWIWVYDLIEKHGIAWMEDQLKDPFIRMNEWVAEDQRMREALKLKEQQRNAAAPQGFSKPRKSKRKGDGGEGKSSGRR